MEPRVAVGPLVRVDDAAVSGVADRRPPEEVGRHRDVEDIIPAAAGEALDLGGDPADGIVADRDPGGVGGAVALPRRELPAAEEPPLGEARDRVVPGLHDQGDDDLLRPVPQAQVPQQHHRVAGGLP